MKKIIIILVLMILGCIFVQRQQYKKIHELKVQTESLTKQLDSLKDEIMVKDIEVGRYESILDRAETEFKPECVEELHTILSQTE